MNEVFESLKSIMKPYSQSLNTKYDDPGHYYLDTYHIMKNKKPLFFGAVQIKKNYVSYHLMPVYVNPALLNGMHPELKKHMQGKSCFNFKSVDENLFQELAVLTKLGYEDYRTNGFIEHMSPAVRGRG